MADPGPRRGDHGAPFVQRLDWERLWSTARIELGLSDAEFWRLTPRELDLLTVAQRRKKRMDVLPMALLIQMTANIHRDTQQRFQPFELDEVLEWLGVMPEPEPPAPPPAPATPEELRAKLGLLAQMYPPPNGQQPEGG